MIKSSNPALKSDIFANEARLGSTAGKMTVTGTVNKTAFLLFLVTITAGWAWTTTLSTNNYGEATLQVPPMLVPMAIGGFVVALIGIFKKTWTPFIAPLYALIQGYVLGAISAVYEYQFEGIALQAVMATFGTLLALLMAYRSKLIKPTENFKMGVTAATGGIALMYIINMIMGFFGVNMPFLHDTGPLGIGISVVIVIVAALNLVMDFDFIESGEKAGAPKYMEWYGAFGLLITLVWLYMEMLRLLSKLRSK